MESSRVTLLLVIAVLSSTRYADAESLASLVGYDRASVNSLTASRSQSEADIFVHSEGSRSTTESVCPANCQSCSIIGECLECTNYKYRHPQKATCEDFCPLGYYPTGQKKSNRTCLPCGGDCSLCRSAAECLRCNSPKYLSPSGTCVLDCPDGYHKHGSGTAGPSCWPCSQLCKTCSDENTCAVCADGLYLTPSGDCEEACEDGYFAEDTAAAGGLCSVCPESCSKCTAKSTCTECQLSTYLSKVNSMCKAECDAGYFGVGTGEIGGECQECPAICPTCTSLETCTSCKDGFYLTPEETCESTCPDGTWANAATNQCQSCPSFCDTCSDGSTCTSCMKSRTITSEGKCANSCTNGFFKNGTGVIGDSCQLCPNGCKRCTSGTVCTACEAFNGDPKWLTPNATCESVCPDGYYGDGPGISEGVCKPCDADCTKCMSSQVCTSCAVLNWLTPGGKCSDACPPGRYKKDGLQPNKPGVCAPCESPCVECEKSASYCTKCEDADSFNVRGKCSKDCPVGGYVHAGACWPCRLHEYSCKSLGGSVKGKIDPNSEDVDPHVTVVALKCQHDRYLLDGACVKASHCPIGMYPKQGDVLAATDAEPNNIVGGECADCPRGCHACASPQKCTLCELGKYMDPNGNCADSCPDGYYPHGSGKIGRTCKPCQGSCSKCTSATKCTQCKDSTFLTEGGKCTKECAPGWYAAPIRSSSVGGTCKRCLGDCKTCDSSLVCTSCKNKAYLTHKFECLPQCPATHYGEPSASDEDRKCAECEQPCSECTSKAHCTQCKSPAFLVPRSLDFWKTRGAFNTCQDTCPTGYFGMAGSRKHKYWSDTVGGTCLQCDENCNSCTGADVCSECGNNMFLTVDRQCVDTCPDGFYGSQNDKRREYDEHPGFDCGGTSRDVFESPPSSVEDCKERCDELSCVGFVHVQSGRKKGRCFLRGGRLKKLSRDAPDIRSCFVPKPGIAAPPPGVGAKCMSCDSLKGHSRCTSINKATECTNSLLLHEDDCVKRCPSGYYAVPGSSEDSEGDGPVVGGMCKPCQSPCKTCTSRTECLTCKPEAPYFVADERRCVETCPAGHFMSGHAESRLCRKCAIGVHTCTSETHALTCEGEAYYHDEQTASCVTQCPDGFYEVPSGLLDGTLVGGRCVACSGPVELCVSRLEAIQCNKGAFLDPTDHTCQEKCPAGFFGVGNSAKGRECRPCTYSDGTIECTSANKATSCFGNKYLNDAAKKCVFACPSGYYKSTGDLIEGGGHVGGTCKPCPENCASCYSAFECTVCKSSKYFDPWSTSCVSNCPAGTYPQNNGATGSECLRCPLRFKTCSSATTALSCFDGFHLSGGDCKSWCPAGKFCPTATSTFSGTACEASCSACIAADRCTQCTGGKYLTPDFWCEDECPDGYYKTERAGNRLCERCPLGAFSCISSSIMTECADFKYLTKSGTCENECPVGYYADGYSQVGGRCNRCPAGCSKCLASSVCSQCRVGLFLTPDLWCEAACPDGYYVKRVSGGGDVCVACPDDMMNCISDQLATECKNYKFLSATSTCESKCPDGFYPQGGHSPVGRTCHRCYKDCLTCSDIDKCESCANGRFLSPQGWCERTCPGGYYPSTSKNTCEICPISASRCISATKATECNFNKYLDPSFSCKESCPVGYYPVGQGQLGRRCARCDASCLDCSSASVCSKCGQNKYLTPNSWCEDRCPDGYYKFETDDGRVCQPCSTHASKCINITFNTECRNSKYLNPWATCEADCPKGYFPRGDAVSTVGRDCPRCTSNCSACVRSDLCTECQDFTYLHQNGRCGGGCPSTHYPKAPPSTEDVTYTQVKDHDCGGTTITTWRNGPNSGYGLQFIDNLPGCKAVCTANVDCAGFVQKTYRDPVSLVTTHRCSFWKAGPLSPKPKRGHTCWKRSDISQVWKERACSGEKWTVKAIKHEAKKLTAIEDSDTFAFIGPVSRFEWKAGQTDKRVYIGLTKNKLDTVEFSGGAGIQLGDDGKVRVAGSGPKPYDTNDKFKIELDGDVIKAYKNSKLLFTSSQTKGFSAGMTYAKVWMSDYGATLDDVHNTCKAIAGVAGVCEECPGHMNKCVSDTIALECKNSMYLRRTHECATDCPMGDYKVEGNADGTGSFCLECPPECANCVSPTVCTECRNNHYLTADLQCVVGCPTGYYPEIPKNPSVPGLGNVCNLCHENCSACDNWEECTECRLYNYRTPSKTCKDTCPDHYWKKGNDEIGNECHPCMENCHICTNPTTCQVCNSSLYLDRLGQCREHCPPGDYKFGDAKLGNECRKCPTPFNKCISAEYASECKENTYLTPDGDCANDCPDGFYKKMGNEKTGVGHTCARCATECNRCLDASTCTECRIGRYLTPDKWCDKECPIGHFKVGTAVSGTEVGNTCKKCSADCRTCIDEETCMECTNAKFLNPDRSCSDSCPINFFQFGSDTVGRTCPPCERNCHRCSSFKQCLECNNSMHLDDADNCVPACSVGFYAVGDQDRGRYCETCPMNYCKDCTAPDACSECTEGRYLNPDLTCQTECEPGTYKRGVEEDGRDCPECFMTCKTCTTADLCTECKNFTFLTPDFKCLYECPDRYYEKGTEEVGGICDKCSEDCLECSSPSVCLKCENGKYLDATSSSCKTECPDGFWEKIYADSPNPTEGRECQKCPQPCNTCESPERCTECKDNAFLTHLNTCEYTCPPNYYPDGGTEVGTTCERCSANANTCDTFAVSTQCKNDMFLNPDATCQPNCPIGYYEHLEPGGIGNQCWLCADSCSKCTDLYICQECRNSTYLTHYDWCEAECQDGYFENGDGEIGRTCQICPSPCNKCEDYDHCTECKSGHYLTKEHVCEETCARGFYPNKTRDVGELCESCPPRCSQCTTESTCTECRNGLYLTPDAWCEDECPVGHWKRPGSGGIGGTCPMCPENCFSCESNEKCTECRGFTHMTEYNQCRSECPAGWYEHGTAARGGDCRKCPSPCSLCESEGVCTECGEGKYLTPTGTCESTCPDSYHFEGTGSIGRFCQVCPGTCLQCYSQDACHVCQNFTYLTPTQQCEYTCPDGFWRKGTAETGNTCEPCPANVAKCITDTYHTECKNGMYLNPNSQCQGDCPNGYFMHGADVGEVGRTCPLCATNCSMCTSIAVCQECKNSQYLTASHWCDHECPDGYYKFGSGEVGRVCRACSPKCNTCLGLDVCTECKHGAFLTPTAKCELQCPDGHYKLAGPNGVGGTCAICPSNCATCISETECTICTNKTYLHDNKCKPRCPDGFWHDGAGNSGRKCKACKPECTQCTSLGKCTECQDNLYLTDSWTCEQVCPEGYFEWGLEEVGRTCELCAQNCSKCTDRTTCQECKNSHYLTHYSWCLPDCPDGFFQVGRGKVGRTCSICPESCNLCESSGLCTECKDSKYLTHLNQCETSCPVGYYHEGDDDIGRVCPPCESDCHQCESKTWCSECKNFAYLTPELDCKPACAAGYYKQGEERVGNTCEKCSKDCSACTSFDQCTECTNSSYLTPEKFCSGECTTGFLETGDVETGRTCEQLCFWCSEGR